MSLSERHSDFKPTDQDVKKFSIKDSEPIPTGPGVEKKVILTIDDVRIEGTIQMINWARIEVGKRIALHYHESMDEIFIVLSGKAEIEIDNESILIEATDTVYIPQKAKHEMKNIGTEPMEFLAIGIVKEAGGKTVVVDKSE